jgi:hypothetical protein
MEVVVLKLVPVVITALGLIAFMAIALIVGNVSGRVSVK